MSTGLDAELRVDRGAFALDVAVTAEPGEVVGMLGPNGAGKSTALRALAGLVALDAGHVRLGAHVLDDPDRGVLVPVETAGRVAERIEAGDLTARVPVTSRDEFGLWAARFNRMAQAMDDLVTRLEASQAQNRRFVADVSHELRTPLTALVAEASILRESLGDLPPASRRAGELLVQDVARLRTLVDELMELLTRSSSLLR